VSSLSDGRIYIMQRRGLIIGLAWCHLKGFRLFANFSKKNAESLQVYAGGAFISLIVMIIDTYSTSSWTARRSSGCRCHTSCTRFLLSRDTERSARQRLYVVSLLRYSAPDQRSQPLQHHHTDSALYRDADWRRAQTSSTWQVLTGNDAYTYECHRATCEEFTVYSSWVCFCSTYTLFSFDAKFPYNRFFSVVRPWPSTFRSETKTKQSAIADFTSRCAISRRHLASYATSQTPSLYLYLAHYVKTYCRPQNWK